MSTVNPGRRLARRAAILVIAAVALAVPASAGAHIQVRPSEAAPLDPTLWTVLVPSERNVGTTRVELKVPEQIVPFSFEDVPGWKRTLKMTSDGAIDTITWTGRTAPDGLAQFQFLGTPSDREGTVEWKALQTYADGKVVRWIGGPDSEEPASVTTISRDVAPQNAGGEGADADSQPAAADDGDQGDDDSGGGSDTLAVALGGVALLVALAALAVALAGRRRAKP